MERISEKPGLRKKSIPGLIFRENYKRTEKWECKGLKIDFASSERITILAITLLITLGSNGLLIAAQDSSKNKIIPIPFSTIDKGMKSGLSERKFIIIKSEKKWENIWRLHKAPLVPEKQIPLIDFRQEMIVAVFSGEKKTGGYGIEITKIEENRYRTELIVYFLEAQPRSNAIVTQALTQPYHIVKAARTGFTVKFIPRN